MQVHSPLSVFIMLYNYVIYADGLNYISKASATRKRSDMNSVYEPNQKVKYDAIYHVIYYYSLKAQSIDIPMVDLYCPPCP